MSGKFATIPIIFSMIVSLSGQVVKEAPLQTYQNADAYEVYSAVLVLEKAQSKMLLIDDTTTPFSNCLESSSDKTVKSAVDNYRKANASKWQLGYHFAVEASYKLLPMNEGISYQDKPTSAPSSGNPVHRFSAVGFNANKTIAFVEMDLVCGFNCGHGQPYILQKREGKWQEYSSQPRIIQHKKLKDGSYQVTMEGGSLCSWAY